MFAESRGLKEVTERYHHLRHRARTETVSLAEWGEQEIIDGDLDEGYDGDLPVPTGEDVDRTYEWRRDIDSLGSNGTDVRTLDDR